METTDRLRHIRKPGEQAQHHSAGKTPYKAFSASKELQRYLEIRPKFPDPAECPPYGMITNFRVEWRWGLAVTIIYGKTIVVEIKGKRLQELAKALKEWKVEWLAEFDPQKHDSPSDESAPLIESIQITTNRSEESDLPRQLH